MSSPVNEALIRDIITDVLGRLGTNSLPKLVVPPPAPAPACGCDHNGAASRSQSSRGTFGVFQDANTACDAAREAYLQLQEKGVAARAKIVDIIKGMADANAVEWGRIELEETKIGRLDHKIEKLKIIRLVPGVEWIRPDGRPIFLNGRRPAIRVARFMTRLF